mgnify:CR=1 FL=1|jgi:hypothetical protein
MLIYGTQLKIAYETEENQLNEKSECGKGRGNKILRFILRF